jgi:hypothetical protein
MYWYRLQIKWDYREKILCMVSLCAPFNSCGPVADLECIRVELFQRDEFSCLLFEFLYLNKGNIYQH